MTEGKSADGRTICLHSFLPRLSETHWIRNDSKQQNISECGHGVLVEQQVDAHGTLKITQQFLLRHSAAVLCSTLVCSLCFSLTAD